MKIFILEGEGPFFRVLNGNFSKMSPKRLGVIYAFLDRKLPLSYKRLGEKLKRMCFETIFQPILHLYLSSSQKFEENLDFSKFLMIDRLRIRITSYHCNECEQITSCYLSSVSLAR